MTCRQLRSHVPPSSRQVMVFTGFCSLLGPRTTSGQLTGARTNSCRMPRPAVGWALLPIRGVEPIAAVMPRRCDLARLLPALRHPPTQVGLGGRLRTVGTRRAVRQASAGNQTAHSDECCAEYVSPVHGNSGMRWSHDVTAPRYSRRPRTMSVIVDLPVVLARGQPGAQPGEPGTRRAIIDANTGAEQGVPLRSACARERL
jgi:hypothetical protein